MLTDNFCLDPVSVFLIEPAMEKARFNAENRADVVVYCLSRTDVVAYNQRTVCFACRLDDLLDVIQQCSIEDRDCVTLAIQDLAIFRLLNVKVTVDSSRRCSKLFGHIRYPRPSAFFSIRESNFIARSTGLARDM